MGLIRDFIDYRKERKLQRETRSIIKEYYGGDYNLFVWNISKQIYNIPEVSKAIETIAEIFSTIPVYHKVVSKNGDVKYLENDDINYVLGLKANPVQNSIAFFQSCITRLLLENNLFIEPIYENDGKLVQLYPLPYTLFDFELQRNNAYVKFYEQKGVVKEKHNLNNLIYINRFCSLNGGKKNNLGLYETVIQALGNKIINVCNPKKPRALLQGKLGGGGQLKDKDKKGVTETLKASFDENVEGVAYLDEKWQITPINWQENDVNKDLMQFIVNTVFNYFGISYEIINHKATELEMEAFISNTIKPLARQFEIEFTNKLFTKREIEFGNRIEFDVFALSISTLTAKNALFATASRNGILNIDEMREYIGQPPLPNGLGKKYRVSVDCVDIEIADKYQLGKYGMREDNSQKEVVSTTENVSQETTTVEDIKNQQKEDSNGNSETK